MRPLAGLLLLLCISSCNQPPPELKVLPVAEPGIEARLYSKPQNWQNPIVVVLPGSKPGHIKSKALYNLVESGYDAYSLAYHGIDRLPAQLEEVPVEYVHRCIQWLRQKPQTKGRKIVMMAISRGSELALIYSHHFRGLDGLICYAPSSMVLPNHVGYPHDQPYKSSWTLNGTPLPFAPLARFKDPAGKIKYKKYLEPWVAPTTTGAIDVHGIDCPVLLLAGADDLVWPSAQMAHIIEGKIKIAQPNSWVRTVVYADAGHQFLWFDQGYPDFTATSQSMNLTGIKKHRFLFGGTEQGTKEAMVNSRKEVLDFLQMIKY